MSPTWAIVSAAVTVLAIVLSIFGASWLNLRTTERGIEQLEKRFDERFAALEARVDQRFAAVEARMDQRFAAVEARMDQRFAAVEARLDRIERQLEAVFKPVLPSR